MADITFKNLAEAVKAVGGEQNACTILARYVAQKSRDKENRELLKWAKQQPHPTSAKSGAA